MTTSIKVCILGDGGVGKTSFVRGLAGRDFIRKYIPTMGVEVTPVHVEYFPDKVFNVWDCAGQEKYGSLEQQYLKGSHFVIVCFDMTSILSYRSVPFWIKKVYESSTTVPIVVCGLKADSLYAKKFPKRQNGRPYHMISSRDSSRTSSLVTPFVVGLEG